MNPRFLAIISVVVLTDLAVPRGALGQTFSTTDLTSELQAGSGITADGSGNVSGWTDGAAPASSFRNTNLPQEPLLVPNGPGGAPYVHFGISAAGDNPSFLQDDRSRDASTLFSASQSTLFLVLRSQGQSSPMGWADGAGGDPLAVALQQQGPSSSTLITFSFNGSSIRATAPDFSGAWHVVTVERNGSAGQIRVDGVPLALDAGFNSFGPPLAASLAPLYGDMGLGGPGGNPQVGDSLDVAGIFNYKSALSATDVDQMEQSLGSTFGIAVVPEPPAWTSVAAGGLVLAGLCRRVRRP